MTTGDATGVIVPLLELQPVVQRLRSRADGPGVPVVPAHVTVLFPWVTPPVTDDDLGVLAEVAGRFEPFEFAFREVGWFGDDVVWLRPEPDASFRHLTSAVFERWPEHPPYGGEHDEPTPHMTIGETGEPAAMRQVAEIAERLMPWRCRAEELWVMEGTWEPLRWWRRAVVPLGPGSTG